MLRGSSSGGPSQLQAGNSYCSLGGILDLLNKITHSFGCVTRSSLKQEMWGIDFHNSGVRVYKADKF